MTIMDGGPAFPQGVDSSVGMSLRHYFAAKAMEAIVNREQRMEPHQIAPWGYAMADAMLKESVI